MHSSVPLKDKYEEQYLSEVGVSMNVARKNSFRTVSCSSIKHKIVCNHLTVGNRSYVDITYLSK
jgi:gluconate kinase